MSLECPLGHLIISRICMLRQVLIKLFILIIVEIIETKWWLIIIIIVSYLLITQLLLRLLPRRPAVEKVDDLFHFYLLLTLHRCHFMLIDKCESPLILLLDTFIIVVLSCCHLKWRVTLLSKNDRVVLLHLLHMGSSVSIVIRLEIILWCHVRSWPIHFDLTAILADDETVVYVRAHVRWRLVHASSVTSEAEVAALEARFVNWLVTWFILQIVVVELLVLDEAIKLTACLLGSFRFLLLVFLSHLGHWGHAWVIHFGGLENISAICFNNFA